MNYLVFITVFCFFTKLQAGVTDIPPVVTSDDEVFIETVTRDTLIPANIFDATGSTTFEPKAETSNESTEEEVWAPDANPIFRALRDFIFQAGDGLLETTETPDADPTEEIVTIIEKGLAEVTTMFLAPSEASDLSTVPTTETKLEPVTVLQIEEETKNFFDNIMMNSAQLTTEKPQERVSYVENMTVACTNCYVSLESCVQQCFTKHNCNDVQRQVRTCPTQPTRICNFFTQWSPEDECKVHEDCKSPLLCCNDGCVNKCSAGIWRH